MFTISKYNLTLLFKIICYLYFANLFETQLYVIDIYSNYVTYLFNIKKRMLLALRIIFCDVTVTRSKGITQSIDNCIINQNKKNRLY